MQKKIINEKLKEHLDNECLFRIIKCAKCNNEIPFIIKDFHINKCEYENLMDFEEEEEIIDINQTEFEKNLIQNNNNNNKNNSFLIEKIPCKYKFMGCENLIIKGLEENHYKLYYNEHLILIYKYTKKFLNYFEENIDNIKDIKERETAKIQINYILNIAKIIDENNINESEKIHKMQDYLKYYKIIQNIIKKNHIIK